MTGLPPTLLAGRYQIGVPLGRGSFGHTLRAMDVIANRPVAIKVLDPREGADLKVLELFEREAAILRALRHQGIPEIYDVVRAPWEGGEASIIAMELVEGDSIARIIESHRSLDPDEVMHLFLEMLGILDYIHGRVPPVLHRDIKPSNIIVRPNGSPALVDFGSARSEFRGSDDGGSTVAGTYGYMPYEQYMGQSTPSSDLFALAATFLHLLTRRPPRDFIGDDGQIVVPSSLPGDQRLAPVIARLLRHAPNERYATAKEVRRAILPTIGGSRGTSLAINEPTLPPTPAAIVQPLSALTIAAALPVNLGPAPRPLDAPLKQWIDDLAPTTLDLLYADSELEGDAGAMDWASFAFFSVLTAGVLPIVFISMARARRRKIRRFVETGFPAVARIDRIGVEKGPFEVAMAKVSYAFEAEGRVRRGADMVLPSLADRWRVGDTIHVLYDPANVDSIIVSRS